MTIYPTNVGGRKKALAFSCNSEVMREIVRRHAFSPSAFIRCLILTFAPIQPLISALLLLISSKNSLGRDGAVIKRSISKLLFFPSREAQQIYVFMIVFFHLDRNAGKGLNEGVLCPLLL